MKKFIRLKSLLVLGFASAFFAAPAFAQTNAQDSAAAYTAPNWNNGANLGFGFQPWALRNNNGLSGVGNGGFAGFFIGSGGAIDTAGKSFGMYANGDGVNYAVAYRSFTNAMPVNYLLSLKFKNASLDSGTYAGFSLRSSGSTNLTDSSLIVDADTRFSFYFQGGGANYLIWDGNGVTDTGIGYSSGGRTLEFYLLGADTYRLVVKSADGLTTLGNFDNLPLAGSGGITNFAGYCFDTGGGGDVHFNSFQIASTSIVPPVIQNFSPTNGSVYVPASSPISFEVVSPFSGVPSANISLSLNGTNITGLGFAGSPASWTVTKSGALADNVVYTATVIATDVNGNKATNNYSFNTWRDDNFFIEAEAYNYTAGGYIPSPFPGQYDTLGGFVAGTNGIDFLELPDAGTNGYRTLDSTDLERAGDSTDHAGYAGFLLEDWVLSYVQYGEWANYTRRVSNTTYQVYARMSGDGSQPVMRMDRLAAPTATASNQPLATLGTFVGQNTGNVVSNFTFVPLKDFFSSNVLVRFSTTSATTNTFRTTRIGDGYNFNYLIFVPSTDTATQRPYLSAGFPFPNAANVEPDQEISFTIANRQTSVTNIQLSVNGVSAAFTATANAAGTAVSHVPTNLYPLGGNSTVQVIFTDSADVKQTNQWQFAVANLPVIPPGYALPPGSAMNRGLNLHVAKATNSAAPALFPNTLARAQNHLANLINDPNTGLPFYNEAGGPGGNGRYAETNAINYNQAIGFADSGLPGDLNFPYVAQSLAGSYTDDPNYVSLEAIAYAQLSPGIYKWGVRSDDGFRLTFGTGANPTNLMVAEYEGPRSDAVPSEFEFVVQTNGIYPFRLLYFEGDGFASLELYSVNRANGQQILINDLSNGSALQTFRDVPVVILNPAHTGNTSTFSFLTQAGRTHTVEYKNALTNGPWQTLQIIGGDGSTTNITDNTATGPSRFYRVSTQ